MSIVEKFDIKETFPFGFAYGKMSYTRTKEPKTFTILETNEKFMHILGENKGLGLKSAKAMLGDFQPILIEKIHEALRSQEPQDIEMSFTHGGDLYHVHVVPENKAHFTLTIFDCKKTLAALYDERYRLIFENAVEGIMVIQEDFVKISNPKLSEILGYSTTQIRSVPFIQFVYFEDIPAYLKMYEPCECEDKNPLTLTFRIIDYTGDIRWVESKGITIEWQGEKASLRFLVDVTERKYTEDALMRSEEKYRFLTENTSDVIWIYNLSKDAFEYVSPAIKQLIGCSPHEIYEKPLEELLGGETKAKFLEAIKLRSELFLSENISDMCYMDEVQHFHKEGHLLWTEISSKYRSNLQGEVEIIGVSRNVEERKQQESKVLYLSYYDQLTGLNNRRYYEEQLQFLLEKEMLPLTLIVADVNGLKLTNDAFGHVAGDQLLIKVSQELKKALRKNDILARIGGDEFVFVLPDTDAVEAKLFIEGLKMQFEKLQMGEIMVSVSFGFETKTEKDQNIEEVFSRAEDFMYKRKLTESRSMKSMTFKKILQKLHKVFPDHKSHSQLLSRLVKDFAKSMNFSDAEIQDIGMLALVHDVGKVNLPEGVLAEGGMPFAPHSKEYKRHPEIGYQILRSTPEFSHLADFVLCHHECYDGTGYPRHIKGELIPLQSRMLAIVDSYILLTHDPHHMQSIEALEEIRSKSGTYFDPELVTRFTEMFY